MPLSFTNAQWEKETEVPRKIRSSELKRLDTAIGTGNPFLAKKALDEWLAAQSAKNQDWEKSMRNTKGAVTRLYKELGLTNDYKAFVEQLVKATAKCRAGTRVLQVRNVEAIGRPTVPSASAQLWIDCGFSQIVDEDTANARTFYEDLGNLRLKIKELKFLEHTSRPQGLNFGSRDFEDWARVAVGNCAEMGSHDGCLWAESICARARIDFSQYRTTLEAAKRQGEREQAEFERARANLQRQAGQVKLPPEFLAATNTKEYMKQIISLNRGVPDVLLAKEFKKQREHVKTTFLLEDDDEDLLTWEVARRG